MREHISHRHSFREVPKAPVSSDKLKPLAQIWHKVVAAFSKPDLSDYNQNHEVEHGVMSNPVSIIARSKQIG